MRRFAGQQLTISANLVRLGIDFDHRHGRVVHHVGLAHAPIFAPAVVRAFRGMIVEVPLPLSAMPKAGSADALRAALAAHYAGSPVVTVHTEAAPSELLMHADQAPSDRLDLYVLASPDILLAISSAPSGTRAMRKRPGLMPPRVS